MDSLQQSAIEGHQSLKNLLDHVYKGLGEFRTQMINDGLAASYYSGLTSVSEAMGLISSLSDREEKEIGLLKNLPTNHPIQN